MSSGGAVAVNASDGGPSRPLAPCRPRLKDVAPFVERHVPAAGLVVFLSLAHLGGAAAPALTPWPFLISLLFLGLPHGAADGAVLLRSWRVKGLWAVGLAYLGLFGSVLLLFLVAPAFTVLAFLVLTVIHFGLADAQTDLPARAPLRTRRMWAAARGGSVVAVPFAIDPMAAWKPFAHLIGLLGGPTDVSLQFLGATGGIAVAVALLCGIAVAVSPFRPGQRAWLESALILIVCATTNPLYAVGAYFLAVHAFRQCAGLGADPAIGGAPGDSLARRLLRTHVASIPLLIPSWVLLLTIAAALEAWSAYDLAVLSLGFYIVATLPHHWLQGHDEARLT